MLRLGRTLYVGVGGRTNVDGLEQLAAIVCAHGYEVRPVSVMGCLHLKSAVTEVAPGLLVVNPACVDPSSFADHRAIEVDPAEPGAANVLRVGDAVLAAAAYARTNARIADAGIHVTTVDVSELAKAEAGVTCCSLIFDAAT